jgi:LuxR family maltose regulon positive regulatory protein
LRTAPNDPDTLAEATAWCQDFSSSLGEKVNPPGLGPFGAAEAYYLACLAWIRAQIAIGKAPFTRLYLERHLNLATAHGLTHRVIELSLLDALVSQSEGNPKRACAVLEHALRLAQPEGYIRTFDQGPALTRLLCEAELRAEAAQQGIFKEYIERLLAAIGVPEALDLGREGSAARAAQALYGESLSQRELEVLRLIAQGATNHEIAERLVITVGTVKSHINHILGKLDAHNRTEAVARARGLGLLEI